VEPAGGATTTVLSDEPQPTSARNASGAMNLIIRMGNLSNLPDINARQAVRFPGAAPLCFAAQRSRAGDGVPRRTAAHCGRTAAIALVFSGDAA
jgi:hypothetical protein